MNRSSRPFPGEVCVARKLCPSSNFWKCDGFLARPVVRGEAREARRNGRPSDGASPFQDARGHRPAGGESRLFSNSDGAALSDTTLGVTFRRLRTIAGIGRKGGARDQPRMHDLRHSAAVHRVIAWYRCDARPYGPFGYTALSDNDSGATCGSQLPLRSVRRGVPS
jgi:hypothetical protein